jgi:amphi-Trp domain-containing protein
MAKKNVLVKSAQIKDLADAAVFLRELADKIESGQITLVQGGQDIVVDLPDTVNFELEYYEQSKNHGLNRQLEIELQWSEGGKKKQGVTLG